MSKISITVQVLCVTNSSIAINIWYRYWKTYNKFIYICLTIYLKFSVFSRAIIWEVKAHEMIWQQKVKPLPSTNAEKKRAAKVVLNVKLFWFWVGHETLRNCWGMLFFKPALSSSKMWEKLRCQVSARKGMYGNKEGEWTMLHASWR